jgi:hypothetical protein
MPNNSFGNIDGAGGGVKRRAAAHNVSRLLDLSGIFPYMFSQEGKALRGNRTVFLTLTLILRRLRRSRLEGRG